ncbi:MAG TPA: hypothetical protein VM658_05620, partial [bacterium]|nr:hypothetical protein [bacterium]
SKGTPRRIKLPGGRLENLTKTSRLAFLASWRFSYTFILDTTDSGQENNLILYILNILVNLF